MRTIKLRMAEMMPDVRVFLDKDDLKTGAGAEYVDVSSSVLCFCTVKYFQSRACAREIFRAILKGKPLIAVLEPDASRGGLKRKEIEALLTTARYPPQGKANEPANQTWVAKWALDGEVEAWGYDAIPTGDQIVEALFKDDPIEWNRFSAFQDVSMRLIAEWLLPAKERGGVHVQGEIGSQVLTPPPLTHGRTHHLYSSPHNLGASAVVEELRCALLEQSGKGAERCSAKPLKATTAFAELNQCEHMLLYLTSATWTRGEASAAFAREVEEAQRLGVHLLLVHEFPSVLDDEGASTRGACDFNDFWNEGWTPKHLLTGESNVYKQIAIALKPGAFRAAGLATVIGKMGEGGGERRPLDSYDLVTPPQDESPPALQEDVETPAASGTPPLQEGLETSVSIRPASITLTQGTLDA